MAYYWGPYPPKAQSQPSTPKKPTPKKSTPSNLDESTSTPPAKRQKTSDSPVLRRSQQIRDLAKERDQSRCVLTGDPSIEVAHIYPYHSLKHREEDMFGQRHIFWDQLENFWSKEKIATWQAELFPADLGGIHENGIERVYNLITLSRTAQDMWGRGAFALKLILKSDDKMTLEVQFFWQQKQKDIQQTMNLLTTPSSTQGLDGGIGAFGEEPVARLHKPDDTRIQSGDYFKLQTDDPEMKPLPSFQLLEMQWFLQRIQGMAGAADFDWPSLSESSSECSEVLDLELDKVGNTSLLSPQLPSPLTKLERSDKSSLSIHHKHQVEQAEGNGNGDRLELQE